MQRCPRPVGTLLHARVRPRAPLRPSSRPSPSITRRAVLTWLLRCPCRSQSRRLVTSTRRPQPHRCTHHNEGKCEIVSTHLHTHTHTPSPTQMSNVAATQPAPKALPGPCPLHLFCSPSCPPFSPSCPLPLTIARVMHLPVAQPSGLRPRLCSCRHRGLQRRPGTPITA